MRALPFANLVAAVVVACALEACATAQAARADSNGAVCSAAGAYMHDVGIQRDKGVARDAAAAAVAVDFETLAASKQDLDARRRVLVSGKTLASMIYDLRDLKPTTLQHVGESYCLARNGDLAAFDARTLSKVSNGSAACEERSPATDAALASCVTRVVAAETRVANVGGKAGAGSERSIKPILELGVALGGDTVGTILFVNGDDQDIKTGDGVTIAGGLVQRINDSFGIKYSAGYKVSFSAADNADVMKSVLPIDIIPYYQRGDHRFGVGISHHISPKIDWDWLAAETKFDDATGLTLMYSYRGFGVSYTNMDYETNGVELDASHLTFQFAFFDF